MFLSRTKNPYPLGSFDWGSALRAAGDSVKVVVQTPAGPIEVPLSQVASLAKRTQLKIGAPPTAPQTPVERVTRAVEQLPGGWIGPAIGAGLVGWALSKLFAGRRRGRR